MKMKTTPLAALSLTAFITSTCAGTTPGVSLLQQQLRPFTTQTVFQPGEIQGAEIRLKDPGTGTLEFLTVTIDGQEHPAMRIHASRTCDKHFDVQVMIPMQPAVKKGETYLVAFFMRTIDSQTESGDAKTFFRIQRKGPDWARFAARGFWAGKDWTLCYFAGEARNDFDEEELRLVFSAGFYRQTFEIAGLTVLKLSPDTPEAPLPRMVVSYDGMEDDAPWREEARNRIEQIRKAPVHIHVQHPDGTPVADASISLNMQNSAFNWGSAACAAMINGDSADSERYRAEILNRFNTVTLGNDLKWCGWQRDRQRALDALNWLKENNLRGRGHVLVWPSWLKTRVREKAALMQGPPALLRQTVDTHIRDITSATRDYLQEWDVVNELWDNHDYTDILGMDVVLEWFQTAREVHPEALLFINDYGYLNDLGRDEPKHQHYYDLIKWLVDSGAQIDGIGFQGHIGATPTPPTRILDILDRFAAFGLNIQITEFDSADFSDEDLQARYLRDVMTAVYSHPATIGFVKWGFWEGLMHFPEGAMLRKDWSEKPNGAVWRDLIFNTWRTRVDAGTGADGCFETRAFHGRYALTVTHGDAVVSQTFTLDKHGAALTVVIP